MNGDRVVNVLDLQLVASRSLGFGTYLLQFDINKDGQINVIDLQLIAKRLDEIC